MRVAVNNTSVVAVGHRTGRVIANHTAHCATADRTGVVAVDQRAISAIMANNATGTRVTFDRTSIVTVGHSTGSVIANHTANILVTIEIAVHNAQVFHLSAAVDVAKQAHIVCAV